MVNKIIKHGNGNQGGSGDIALTSKCRDTDLTIECHTSDLTITCNINDLTIVYGISDLTITYAYPWIGTMESTIQFKHTTITCQRFTKQATFYKHYKSNTSNL
jgi:hypothetical protein